MLPEKSNLEIPSPDQVVEISPLGPLHFGSTHSSASPKAYELKLRHQASELNTNEVSLPSVNKTQ